MKAVTVVCNDAEYFLRHRTPTVERLAQEGTRVTVMTGGRVITAQEQRGWTHEFVPIERFAFNPISDLRLLWTTARHCLAVRPEAVHLITLKPALFSGFAAVFARALSGAPQRVLITIPGLGRLMSPAAPDGNVKTRITRWLTERGLGFLSARRDLVFTFETSHDRAKWLNLGLVRDNNAVVICGSGVDPAAFHPPVPPRPSEKPLKILFASRLLRSKGLDVFIEVAKRFADRGECTFLVAGMVEPHDPDGYSIEALAREPAVKFLGEIRDMPELLRGVDVVCLPTRYGEGIPRILIEAAATGLPCVATDVPGCREIIVDGRTGILCPGDDNAAMVDAFATAIAHYLADPASRARQGAAALDHFRAGDYAEARVVERFIGLLEGRDLAAPGSGGAGRHRVATGAS